MIYKDPIRTAQ